jgi:MFS family permease
VTDRPSPVAALRHRNFRLLWVGQLVSMSGSLMQSAAILWHVALISPPEHKAIALGAVGLVRVLPIVGFSLISGVVADVYDRRRVMLITQTLMAALAAVLALLTMEGLRTPWPIYLLAALSSAAGAFDGPARR